MKKNTRHYPAEWEKQKCTWLSWPHNLNEWGKRRIDGIRFFYIDLILKILDFQDVCLIFNNEKLLKDFDKNWKNKINHKKKKYKLKKIIIPNNDIWIRDYGPFFVQKTVIDFEFNSWGEKFPPWDLDNNVPKEIAKFLGLEIESYPIIMEGGSLEFNGDDVIMTTEQCLLNKNRNKNLNKNQIENILKSTFNVSEIIWLKRGLEGDHTDGHIDDFARFIGKNKVLLCKTTDKKDGNYKHLNKSRNFLKNWKHKKKKYKLQIIDLPMPDRMEIKKERLPNSYANFIFVNGGIIIPLFNCPSDKEAITILKKTFPKRKIIGIDATLLIQEGGGIHCMTKQES